MTHGSLDEEHVHHDLSHARYAPFLLRLSLTFSMADRRARRPCVRRATAGMSSPGVRSQARLASPVTGEPGRAAWLDLNATTVRTTASRYVAGRTKRPGRRDRGRRRCVTGHPDARP